MLVDSHCHLDYLARDGDLDETVAAARRAGVGALVTISTRLSEFAAVQTIAERFEDVWCSVGVHPHEAGPEGQATPDRLIALSAHPKVVGIGETGLDFYYDNSPREAQRTSFRAHIAAARETGLPLIVHTRDADAETVEMLRQEHAKGAFPGLIHCFTAGAAVAETALELGLFISISGIVTFKKAEELRDIVRTVPRDRLLVETDSPYLAPVPMRGKTNQPAYVAHTAAFLADMLDMTAEAFARTTTDNFYRLFAKAERPAA